MNERFTLHINFVKSKEFIEKIEKNEHRVSGLYLDFFYNDEYYITFTSKYMNDRKKLLLATLYAPNASLMENFRSRVISFSNIFDHRFNIVSDNLLISKSNYGLNYKPDDDFLTFLTNHHIL